MPALYLHAGCGPQPNRGGAPVYCFPASRASAAVRTPLAERLLAVLLLVALSPVFLAAAGAVFIFDGRPVFFPQERYGVSGRPFTMFKFRTMVRRSEDLQNKLQRRRGVRGRLFKLARDPRLTPTGRFLRKTFVDELPQLLNVIRGEMRLVGPRPLPDADRCHYTHAYHELRLRGLPGMTGLWQVSGRNERTFDEMCLLDHYYLCNRSLGLDLRILGRTALLLCEQVVLKRKAEGGGQ